MRHAFELPPDLRQAVFDHVLRAVGQVEPVRFPQEPAYTAALLHGPAGRSLFRPSGEVEFQVTDIADRGRGSAESWSGGDLVITARISNGATTVRKAILAQAKLGMPWDLDGSEREFLFEQIRKMKRLTRGPKVLAIEEFGDLRNPRMISATAILDGEPTHGYSLAAYFVSRVLTTLDGDTRQDP